MAGSGKANAMRSIRLTSLEPHSFVAQSTPSHIHLSAEILTIGIIDGSDIVMHVYEALNNL
jgi:hypothetical protein